MNSIIGQYNKILSSLSSRSDLDSLITKTQNKIKNLKKQKAKELKDCVSLANKIEVLKKYKNDILYYDDLCYNLKLNYFTIIDHIYKA